MDSRQLLVLSAFAVVAVWGQIGPTPLPLSTPATCVSQSESFQTGDLMCVTCPANQRRSRDGFSCECVEGYYKVASSPSIQFVCLECSQSDVTTTPDSLFCLRCGGGTSFDSATRQCTRCPTRTQIFVDSLPTTQFDAGERSCVSCPRGTWADDAGFACVSCGILDCSQCRVESGVCIGPSQSPVLFPSLMFSYFMDNFEAALTQCTGKDNTSACQLIGNLCVLQTYYRLDAACVEVLSLQGSMALPPLYYAERGAAQVLAQTRIQSRLQTRSGDDRISSLPLMLVAFSLNGTFLGFDEELTQQIFLCPDRPSRAESAWRPGVSYQSQCSLLVSELASRVDSPIFYDLLLRDVSPETGLGQMIPVPVLITNYMTSAQEAVNEGDSRSRWQLVRRFFLAEAITDNPQYAETMELFVDVTSNGIMLPYLRITYASWPQDSSNTFTSSFRIVYRQDSSPLLIGLCVTLGMLSVVVLAYAALKTNGFLRRSGALFCELQTFVYLCVEVCAGLSTAIFILLTITATFYLVFFKGQTAFVFTLPVGTQELVFKILLGLGLFCKAVHICYLMWYQCTIDIFFMDWERPRGVFPSSTTQGADAMATMSNTKHCPVSIWRTYFVANEWNEIQSLRKINHSLLLIIVLLFLHVVGLGRLAERDPVAQVTVSENRYSAPPSDILRFSLTSLHFIIIAVCLRVYVFLVHERYVEHKLHQFVDLCSVSNVSVFLAPHKLFGLYIHGRSVHGHADTNMREMNSNFEKEQNNMCGQRGLEVESDLQTYEIALTMPLRAQLDKVLGPLRAERAEAQVNTVTTPAQNQPKSEGQGMSDTIIKAYESMNKFLTSFLDRSIGGELDYAIKNKILAEKILGIEFRNPENNSLLYRDPGYSFDRVLFYGHFWNLLLLELLVFAVVDLVAHSYPLATILTLIFSWVIDWIRDGLGRRNLARKTLVDNRFLI